MRHSRERESSQRNHHIERKRRRMKHQVWQNVNSSNQICCFCTIVWIFAVYNSYGPYFSTEEKDNLSTSMFDKSFQGISLSSSQDAFFLFFVRSRRYPLPSQKRLSSLLLTGCHRACPSVVLVLATCLDLRVSCNWQCCSRCSTVMMPALQGHISDSPTLNLLYM